MIDAGKIKDDANAASLPAITLTAPDGRQGTITLSMAATGGVDDHPTITLTSTGEFAGARRTVYLDFAIYEGYRVMRDYGVASRSPISMIGSAAVRGSNYTREGSLFSSSGSNPYAIYLDGKSTISGDAAASLGLVGHDPNASIGGDILTEADEPPWPVVDPAQFKPYVETVVLGDVDGDVTLSNIRIPPNTNPTFSGHATINGVVYIEPPNVVTFAGNVELCGIVVAEPPAVANYDANQVIFTADLDAKGVEHLPADPRFNGLRDKTGTFALTPGFKMQFDGSFATVHGYMIGGKFRFAGGAVASVRGGVVNLSDTSFSIEGTSRLSIDKSGVPTQPAGVRPRYSLVCDARSYRE
jgi:hypothetical protein